MKKVEIILNGYTYLQRFEPNENYINRKHAIQSTLHDASEYTPIWCTDPKAFDLRTATGYLSQLCECYRWEKFEERTITLHFITD